MGDPLGAVALGVWLSARVDAPIFAPIFTAFLHRHRVFLPRFYVQKNMLLPSFLIGEKRMDILFLAGVALLWGVTVLLVAGFERLAQVGKGTSA